MGHWIRGTSQSSLDHSDTGTRDTSKVSTLSMNYFNKQLIEQVLGGPSFLY